MNRLLRGLAAVAVASLPILLYAADTGPDPRYTDGPGDLGNCTACHGGTANTFGGNVSATFSSGSTYTPGGGPITITVTVTDPVNATHGFQMSARLGSEPATAQAGRFTSTTGTVVICEDNTLRNSPANGGNCPTATPLEFIEHSEPRIAAWTFTWTPPATNVGNVNFYIAGNAVNNNGSEDDGDHVYTNSYVLAPQGAAAQTSDNSLVLSHLVGGGPGWHTTVFLTNLSNTAESFTINFYNDAGQPTLFPLGGTAVSSITDSLAPAQTKRYETPATGSEVVAWAILTPATPGTHRISGLGIFRLVKPAPDPTAEAVVDFAPPSEKKYVLLYDNTAGFVTSAAVANPDALSTSTILIDIRDEAGTLIGTDHIDLPPLGHAAFEVLNRFPITAGKRGSIRLSSSPRGFTGLGLRFSPLNTFTSFRFLTSPDIQ